MAGLELMRAANKAADKRKESMDKFVNDNVKKYPNADRDVLMFIADFMFHGTPYIQLNDSAEVVRHTFRAGYCYYFAVMLHTAFGRGSINWAAPFGHIVWTDVNGRSYDIEGVYNGECDYYIPIEYLGKALDDFRHVPNEHFGVTKDQLDEIVEVYKRDNNLI